ncbi:nucleotidyltransferase domain-containing protein [Cellulomonas sp. GbtcB1]|jgi:predicted nucleotidyltransferase|uniref:nucleotidyltransferase domain-containing protein n=1 Tax=Cellulomonas sp. GbtcB1 TaxID=2824746 RepID=UPI001C2F63C5|nr:nucleotidyltransferase domain-containing protein [Cellulomonas sp. GbtcB1]
MDLSDPLRSLIPSLDSAALAVLAGTESALSASQVARLAGRGSRAGLSLVLERLSVTGLITAEPSNTGAMYRLNRSHVLAPAVESAVAARREVVSRLRAAVGALTPVPAHASLFGSFARGAGDEASDLDLLVVTPPGLDRQAESWRAQMRALEDDVLTWTGNTLEPLVLSTDELVAAAAAGEPLVEELARDALVLVGSAFDALLPGRSGPS